MDCLTARERVERYEHKILAPYACFSSGSRGRQYLQPEHPIRTAFQRDRDRVIHSAAFRRLEYKTQVFVNHEGDHYRTRLTHSIEVAQISRTIARALGVNEDLAEAIALAHDLGHTPFGHSGEEVLDELMADFGGFNHNRQSLRVVDILERRYPQHPGLNLTYEVRAGIAKHEMLAEPISPEKFPTGERPSLEAALVDVADAIAYNSHDIDDGLSSGILDWNTLDETEIWKEARVRSEELSPGLEGKYRRYSIVRLLVNRQVSDLVERTARNIVVHNIRTLDDVRQAGERLVAFSPEVHQQVAALKKFLNERMYCHPHLIAMADQAREIIETLFAAYKDDPSKLHGKFKLRLNDKPVETIIADFIAGMTDRYAYQVYRQLY
ncbi:MAG: deoxyguanosinetriphosphate triphosphohydrolase [Candidatus Zixiibacteriota bacterium]|nr:MAG: deoxyguanosinetriphosphate triphosphohydrolase [candidate division Zixibacteria bacterium]